MRLQRDSFHVGRDASCDVVIADGASLVWASRILRQPLPERVAGIDLFTELLARAVLRGGDAALAAYQGLRDGIVRGLMDVTDRIASFAWTLDSVREDHLLLSREMNAEVTALLGEVDAPLPPRARRAP